MAFFSLNFILHALLIVCSYGNDICDDNLGCGGIVDSDVTLKLSESPYQITRDILVLKDATLKVEPGVELRFDPQVMLAVNGTLDAKVKAE